MLQFSFEPPYHSAQRCPFGLQTGEPRLAPGPEGRVPAAVCEGSLRQAPPVAGHCLLWVLHSPPHLRIVFSNATSAPTYRRQFSNHWVCSSGLRESHSFASHWSICLMTCWLSFAPLYPAFSLPCKSPSFLASSASTSALARSSCCCCVCAGAPLIILAPCHFPLTCVALSLLWFPLLLRWSC